MKDTLISTTVTECGNEQKKINVVDHIVELSITPWKLPASIIHKCIH